MEIRLGERIRTLRKEAGFTQEQLAEALGVTTGAVYKWESGRAVPELGMLVELAEFFEVSVDALLDYGWERLSMGKALEKLKQFAVDKNLEEGMRFAEKVLQKYPNSFDVVYQSAELYFLSMEQKNMPRAVELFEKASGLLNQNTNDQINPLVIQNMIASCYCYMDRMDEAIAIFKKNNVGGMNNYRIGLLLSQDVNKADEALKYLSDAMVDCYGQLYNLCIGYANAYGAKEEIDKTYKLILWLYELGNGLRDTAVINWMDRGNVRLFTILAEIDYLRGNENRAYDWLVKAKITAEKFDGAPNYRTGTGLKFYHGSPNVTSYDDMGGTAMAMIENYMEDNVTGKNLRPLWAKIRTEE